MIGTRSLKTTGFPFLMCAIAIRRGNSVKVINLTKNETYETEHQMTHYQVEMVLAGSLINLVKQKAS